MCDKTYFLGMLVVGVICGPSPSSAQTSLVADLAWLAGCWEQRSADLLIQEHWLEPRAGLILGMSRTTRGETLIGYEFMRISSRGDTIVLVAQPSNQATTEFVASARSIGEVTFENPTHDFPQQIRYWAIGPDTLMVRIEGRRGGELRRIDFHYAREACPSAPR